MLAGLHESLAEEPTMMPNLAPVSEAHGAARCRKPHVQGPVADYGGPGKVVVGPSRVTVPEPNLIKPPFPPPFSKSWAIVMANPPSSIFAPPARMNVSVRFWKNAVLSLRARSVPPLKLKRVGLEPALIASDCPHRDVAAREQIHLRIERIGGLQPQFAVTGIRVGRAEAAGQLENVSPWIGRIAADHQVVERCRSARRCCRW